MGRQGTGWGEACARIAAARRQTAVAAVVAGLLGGSPVAADAAAATAGFRVTVNLTSETKSTVQCESSNVKAGEGSAVNVSCVETAPLPTTSQAAPETRFLLQLSRGGGTVGTVEGLLPPGTVTSWRVINAAERDYLEIIVGW